jgi:hypothetical protein
MEALNGALAELRGVEVGNGGVDGGAGAGEADVSEGKSHPRDGDRRLLTVREDQIEHLLVSVRERENLDDALLIVGVQRSVECIL